VCAFHRFRWISIIIDIFSIVYFSFRNYCNTDAVFIFDNIASFSFPMKKNIKVNMMEPSINLFRPFSSLLAAVEFYPDSGSVATSLTGPLVELGRREVARLPGLITMTRPGPEQQHLRTGINPNPGPFAREQKDSTFQPEGETAAGRKRWSCGPAKQAADGH